MSFDEVSDFHPAWSFEQRALAYGIFGGVPAYAERVARHATPYEAVHDLALSPAGALHSEPEFLVREELRDPGAYFSILHSLAAGMTRPNEIAQDAGLPGQSVGKYLDVLRRMRIVRREVPVTEARPERSRQGTLPAGRFVSCASGSGTCIPTVPRSKRASAGRCSRWFVATSIRTWAKRTKRSAASTCWPTGAVCSAGSRCGWGATGTPGRR